MSYFSASFPGNAFPHCCSCDTCPGPTQLSETTVQIKKKNLACLLRAAQALICNMPTLQSYSLAPLIIPDLKCTHERPLWVHLET